MTSPEADRTVDSVTGAPSPKSGPVDQAIDDLLTTLGRTTDAMIAIDDDLRIVGWNDAATELFGLKEEEALGRKCSSVMCWRDRVGNPVCAVCNDVAPVENGDLMPTREVIGSTGEGKALWLSATTIVPPLEIRPHCRLVHLVREVALPPELERLVVERLKGWSPATEDETTVLSVLTTREAQVLRLLTEGLDGSAIAQKLYISQATVRNHIQHILAKLDVHSRTEAVALALRTGSPGS